MQLQINILLLLCGALQGVILAVLIARKKSLGNGNLFLLFYLLVLMLQILMKVVNKIWLLNNLKQTYQISYYLPLLYGPLVFLFIRHSLNNRHRFAVRDLFHFLPFTVIGALLIKTGGHLSMGNYYVSHNINELRILVLMTSIVAYHSIALAKIRQFERDQGLINLFLKEKLNWLRQFSVASFGIIVLIAVALYCMYRYTSSLNGIRYLFAAMTFFIYWVSFMLIRQPAILQIRNSVFHYQANENITNASFQMSPALTVRHSPKKYSSSTLKDEDAGVIIASLSEIMQKQKIYLDPDLTIEKLATMIHTNRHNLSQVLNERMNRSFYDYINSLRVEEAKLFLLDKELSYKIAAIAYDAGFNSLSTFNEVFKKITGGTPSDFRTQARNTRNEQRI